MTDIHPTAVVDPGAVIGEGCKAGPYAVIGPDVVLGDDCEVGAHVILTGPSRFGNGNRFYPSSSIGTDPQDLKFKGEKTELVVGDDNIFREFSTVNRGTTGGGGITRVGSRCLLMAYSHIAHDCIIGDDVVMANCATLAGHVAVDDGAIIGGLTPIHQFVRIGRHAFIGGMSRIPQDVAPYTRVAGVPAKVFGVNTIGLERRGFSADAIANLKAAVRVIFQSGLNTTQALEKVAAEVPPCDEVADLVRFIATSDRGVVR